MLITTTVNWEILPSIDRRYIHTELVKNNLIDDDVWHKAFIRKCDFLNLSVKLWSIIDGLSLRLNNFKRGVYIG